MVLTEPVDGNTGRPTVSGSVCGDIKVVLSAPLVSKFRCPTGTGNTLTDAAMALSTSAGELPTVSPALLAAALMAARLVAVAPAVVAAAETIARADSA